MKNWFPFSDYDFYAYITAGMLLIAACDFTFGGSVLISRSEWTVVQVVFWTAIAYIAGQLMAGPSSALLEQLIARKILYPPSAIILGLKGRRWHETIIAALFAAREYAPLPLQVRTQILKQAGQALDIAPEDLREAEAVFSVAFRQARSNQDAASRMDQFRNLYGFSRNVCFVGIISTILLAVSLKNPTHDSKTVWLMAGAMLLAFGMFGRFMKFYAAYSREVFGAYLVTIPAKPPEA